MEGAAPRNPPFVGVVHGVWTLHPRAVCRSQPAPARASSWTCVRTGAEGLSGGNWIMASVPPVRRGGRCGWTSRTFLPCTTHRPFGGPGAWDRSPRGGLAPQVPGHVRYLVDSASSHMLVSKIKPCMSKYKQLVL